MSIVDPRRLFDLLKLFEYSKGGSFLVSGRRGGNGWTCGRQLKELKEKIENHFLRRSKLAYEEGEKEGSTYMELRKWVDEYFYKRFEAGYIGGKRD